MYDVRKSNAWSSIAPEFGVSFGSRHVVIHVQLPDDFGVIPDAYRTRLQLDGGDQHQIEIREFADLVRENMPDWLAEIIRGYGPQPSASATDIERELQSLLNALSVGSTGLRVKTDSEKEVEEGTGRGEAEIAPHRTGPRNDTTSPGGRGGDAPAPSRYHEVVGGAKRAAHAHMRETAPKIHWLDDEETIVERNVDGKAGCFVQTSNELFINCRYAAVELITAHLSKMFAGLVATLGDRVPETAREIAISIVTTRVGRAVIYAKAHLNSHRWTAEDVERACQPECLSVVCDDWIDAMSAADHQMKKRLGLSAKQARDARAA
jgi:hypothetical protein